MFSFRPQAIAQTSSFAESFENDAIVGSIKSNAFMDNGSSQKGSFAPMQVKVDEISNQIKKFINIKFYSHQSTLYC